ncbi:nucleoside triphosphate pyrophosphohydrolase [Mesohalobacter halotolerans]|jgi:XTP/dITP diphosphohydrolase|uniref:Nucleoside triphosphate pyrophosphohydrolase n=1 Tax=Mesohalobacter halotolerans TaxID=1883405 RepID=A0A4U5TPS8_9FLAO|nr:nucleoside triphosphate pyrophosphohydrolase [Mesohalobacter halotolerans]MBS3738516.1 nucleoside triphosphate pyrophosphohydrolase [Psychroflexus sp.]NBC58882.1 nucleoside triphosphate pyrophosphohydrolase [Bacteroidota bacterium]TKS55892.1 nucleoside triphosphate pyrophosphohydrolase [Mesohalobacter halotolerans]
MKKPEEKSFSKLLKIMDELRAGCPWDKKQTIHTLSHLTIEETYELTDAILEEDFESMKGELGDILLHIVFYAKIASEKNKFDIEDVIETICKKLIHRHPHIYGNTKVENEEEVKQNWENLKLKEGKNSVLEGVPKSLPALVKAQRIQDKVAGVGFDWEKPEQILDKVKEEIEEFELEAKTQNHEKMEEEFGDMLFALINYARHHNINPERALQLTNKKFTNRFIYLEKETQKQHLKLQDMTLDEMNKFWEEAKNL